MHSEQLEFVPAFDRAFSKLGFDPEVRRAAKGGVGRLFSAWKQRKKERKEAFLLAGSRGMSNKAHEPKHPLH